jgi:hypothetical protein
MKPLRWLLLVLVLSGPGCLGLPKLVWEQPAAPAKPAVEVPPPPPPVVRPDEVNENNYVQKTEALREELDYAATHPVGGRPAVQGFAVDKQ